MTNTPDKSEEVFLPDTDLVADTLTEDAVESDGTPVLDEEDLEENDLTEEEAEEIVWDEPTATDKE